MFVRIVRTLIALVIVGIAFHALLQTHDVPTVTLIAAVVILMVGGMSK